MDAYRESLEALFRAVREQTGTMPFKGNVSKARDVLQRHLDTMSSYIDAVYEQERVKERADALGGQELRDEFERVDGKRTNAHNAAMGSLNVVNRVFASYGLEPFIAVEEGEDRSSIGEKIAAYVSVVFLGADEPLSRSEAAILAHEKGCEHDARSQRLKGLLESFCA